MYTKKKKQWPAQKKACNKKKKKVFPIAVILAQHSLWPGNDDEMARGIADIHTKKKNSPVLI